MRAVGAACEGETRTHVVAALGALPVAGSHVATPAATATSTAVAAASAARARRLGCAAAVARRLAGIALQGPGSVGRAQAQASRTALPAEHVRLLAPCMRGVYRRRRTHVVAALGALPVSRSHVAPAAAATATAVAAAAAVAAATVVAHAPRSLRRALGGALRLCVPAWRDQHKRRLRIAFCMRRCLQLRMPGSSALSPAVFWGVQGCALAAARRPRARPCRCAAGTDEGQSPESSGRDELGAHGAVAPVGGR